MIETHKMDIFFFISELLLIFCRKIFFSDKAPIGDTRAVWSTSFKLKNKRYKVSFQIYLNINKMDDHLREFAHKKLIFTAFYFDS